MLFRHSKNKENRKYGKCGHGEWGKGYVHFACTCLTVTMEEPAINYWLKKTGTHKKENQAMRILKRHSNTLKYNTEIWVEAI